MVLVLAVAAASLDRDISGLAIQLLVRILCAIRALASDPLEMLQSRDSQSQYETSFIADIISQMGSLLAISFGEAGRSILADSLSPPRPSISCPRQAHFRPFGFFNIRNFTDVTEVLQEEVMAFVNEVAVIVHSLVDQCLGAANKNIGDAFLECGNTRYL